MALHRSGVTAKIMSKKELFQPVPTIQKIYSDIPGKAYPKKTRLWLLDQKKYFSFNR